MNTGSLSNLQLSTLRDVIRPFLDRFDHIVMFGSRADGTCRPNSDLDLAIFGGDPELAGALLTDLIDSDLSIGVDVVDADRVEDAALQLAIAKTGRQLFTASDLL